MNTCECGGELSALGSKNHLACEECGDAYWENEDGSLDKDDDFDAWKFADNAVGDSNWRRE